MFEENMYKQPSFDFCTVYRRSILMTENKEIITITVGAFHCYDKRS